MIQAAFWKLILYLPPAKQETESALFVCCHLEGVFKNWGFNFFISFIISEDADFHVLHYLENCMLIL